MKKSQWMLLSQLVSTAAAWTQVLALGLGFSFGISQLRQARVALVTESTLHVADSIRDFRFKVMGEMRPYLAYLFDGDERCLSQTDDNNRNGEIYMSGVFDLIQTIYYLHRHHNLPDHIWGRYKQRMQRLFMDADVRKQWEMERSTAEKGFRQFMDQIADTATPVDRARLDKLQHCSRSVSAFYVGIGRN